MANSVDPDETPRSAASHLGLNCLLRPICPNTYGKYGILKVIHYELGIMHVLHVSFAFIVHVCCVPLRVLIYVKLLYMSDDFFIQQKGKRTNDKSDQTVYLGLIWFPVFT